MDVYVEIYVLPKLNYTELWLKVIKYHKCTKLSQLFSCILWLFTGWIKQLIKRCAFRHRGKHPANSPHPLSFRAVLRSPPAKRWRAAAAGNKKNYTKTIICLPTNKGFTWGESRATLHGAGLVGKASIDSGKRHRQWNNKSLWALFWDRWRANSSISLLRVRGAKENGNLSVRFFFCIFWLIAVFKIKNNRPKRLPSSPWPLFCASKARFGAQKESSSSAAKTIMYHSCDVEKCDDTSATMAETGEI